MSIHRRFWSLFGFGVASLLVLSACEAEDPEEVEEEPAPVEEAEEEEPAPPEEGRALRVAYNDSIETLDIQSPEAGGGQALGEIMHHSHDTLVDFDGAEYNPELATGWSNPDDETWVFDLRDDVQFHDGSELTAEDVEASVQRLLDQGGPAADLWGPLEEVEATDTYEVTFRTDGPMGTVVSNLENLYIFPSGQLDDDDFWSAPVGTGQYVIEDFAPDQFVTMSVADDPWAGEPANDGLEFQIILEGTSRVTAVLAGDVDVAMEIPIDEAVQVEDAPEAELVSAPSLTYYLLWFNHDREPYDDERVRQAMWYALDVEQTVSDLLGEFGTVAQAPVPQNVLGAGQYEPYPYDPERAEELLAEAGLEDGFETSIEWLSGGGPQIRPIMETFGSYWADVGVDVELRELERAEWIDDLLALEWDMNFLTNTTEGGDPEFTLGRLYQSDAGRLGLEDPALDELLVEGRTAVDMEERSEAYDEAQRLIWEGAYGIFPADLDRTFALRENVEGFEAPLDDRPHWGDTFVSGG